MSPLVSGSYVEYFQPVVDRFEEHLRSTPWGGASLAVYQDGVPVVDVWGGFANVSAGTAWSEDTLAAMFSCGKSVSAIVVLHLVKQGLIDLDEPVATYWPAFASRGKERVTVRDVMAHRAGVPLVDVMLSREEVLAGPPLADALAAQSPLWEPGTAHAYHALTVGACLGEIVRRTAGRSLGTVLREELCEPLDLDLYIGLPDSEQERAALVLPADVTAMPAETLELIQKLVDEDDRALRALTINRALMIPLPGVSLENAYNTPEVRAAELPAVNALSTARSLAKLHAALIGPIAGPGSGGSALLNAHTLDDATRPLSSGPPALGPLIPPYPTWGTGFMVPWDLRPMLGPSSFGHDGAAGGLCFADRDSRVGFAFLPSVMAAQPDIRANAIVTELARCLTVRKARCQL